MSIMDEGVELEVIWDGAHHNQNRDLFRWVEADGERRPGVPEIAVKVHAILEIRRCEECSGPVTVSSRVGKAERATRRFCGRRCAKVSEHRARRSAAA